MVEAKTYTRFFPGTAPNLCAFPVFWQYPKHFPVLFFVSKETIVYYRFVKKNPPNAYIYQVSIREAPLTGRLYHAGTPGSGQRLDPLTIHIPNQIEPDLRRLDENVSIRRDKELAGAG